MPVTKQSRSRYWITSFQVRGQKVRRTTPFLALPQYKVAAQAWEDDLRKQVEAEAFSEPVPSLQDVDYPVSVAEARDFYLRNRNFRFHCAQRVDAEWQLLVDAGLDPALHIRDLKMANIAEWVAWMERKHVDRSGKTFGPWSPTTINNALGHLRALLNYTKELHPEAEIPNITWKRLKLKEPPNRMRWLTRDEYSALYTALPEYLRPLVQFATLTGLRHNNVTELIWSEVDFPREDLNVVVKGRPPRRVRLPMSKATTSLLRSIKDSRPDARGKDRVFLYPASSELPNSLSRMAGKPIKDFRKVWHAACEECGIYDFRFHDLRHTFAVWWLKEGGSIVTLQRMLAHRDITTTMIYVDVDDDDLRLSADKLAKVVVGC